MTYFMSHNTALLQDLFTTTTLYTVYMFYNTKINIYNMKTSSEDKIM